MIGPRAFSTAAALLGFAGLLIAPAAAGTASTAEKRARTACHAEAKQLGIEVPPGACNGPRSRIKFLTAARTCARELTSVTMGQMKCNRGIQIDK